MSTLTPTKSHCSTRPGRCSTMITEDLIWEVLVRLPTKSLMRFKCVSKLWYSIIRNPNFAIAHGSGDGGCFRGLLVLDIYFDTSFWAQRFFYVNPDDNCPRLMQHHLTIREPEYTDVTPIVKGLIGLYNNDINNFTLCNIATHESLELPPSPSPSPSSGPASQDADVYYYFLGFDSVKEAFKVLNLCLCSDGDNISGHLTHVFTLGLNDADRNWRTIAPAPLDLYFQSQQCLCINGALYWLPSEGEYQQTLTAFHLNSETFETIAIPECTKGGADLVEICGRPALVVIDITTDDVEMLDVWTINNNCGGPELEAWTRERVSLPTNLSIDGRLNYAGTLPTGEMMLAGSELNDIPLPLYIYDHLKNKLKSITIDGYGSQENRSDSPENGLEREEVKICYYEENLISLDFLMKY